MRWREHGIIWRDRAIGTHEHVGVIAQFFGVIEQIRGVVEGPVITIPAGIMRNHVAGFRNQYSQELLAPLRNHVAGSRDSSGVVAQ